MRDLKLPIIGAEYLAVPRGTNFAFRRAGLVGTRPKAHFSSRTGTRRTISCSAATLDAGRSIEVRFATATLKLSGTDIGTIVMDGAKLAPADLALFGCEIRYSSTSVAVDDGTGAGPIAEAPSIRGLPVLAGGPAPGTTCKGRAHIHLASVYDGGSQFVLMPDSGDTFLSGYVTTHGQPILLRANRGEARFVLARHPTLVSGAPAFLNTDTSFSLVGRYGIAIVGADGVNGADAEYDPTFGLRLGLSPRPHRIRSTRSEEPISVRP